MGARTHLLAALLLLGAGAQWTRTSLIRQPEPNPGTKQRFGSVALARSGLCGLVAAPGCGIGCQGSVYALARASLGAPFSPVNGTALLPPPSAVGFGAALAVSAACALAIVGAPYTSFSQGRAHAYVPCSTQPSGWCLSATLSVTDLGLPTFGSAVAANAEGWAAAISAKNSVSATGGNGYGSVWFCTAAGLLRNASAWDCERLAPTGSAGDWLGTAVALADDALTLAATLPGRGGSQGSAYVWTRPPGSLAARSGLWALLATLDPNSGACSLGASSNRNFGYALAMTGDASVSVGGAAQGGALSGAALVFERSRGGAAGGAYACTALLRPGRRALGDSVGCSVAVSADGNSVLVGSGLRYAFLFTRAGAGSAYVELTPSNFSQPDQAAFNEDFARSLALSGAGATALIGAPGSSTAADSYKGFALLYDAPPTPAPVPPSPSATATGSRSPTASGSPSPSPSPSPTPSPTPSPSPTETLTGSASDTPSPTASPGASPSASESPAATPSPTPPPGASPPPGAPSASGAPSDAPSASHTGTPSASPPASPPPAGPPGAAAAGNQAAAPGSAAAIGGGIGGGVALLALGAAGAAACSGVARRQAAAAQLTGASKAAAGSGQAGGASAGAGAGARVVGNPLALAGPAGPAFAATGAAV